MFSTITDKLNNAFKQSNWVTFFLYVVCVYPIMVFFSVRIFNSIQYTSSCILYLKLMSLAYWIVVYIVSYNKYKEQKIEKYKDALSTFLKEKENNKASFFVIKEVFGIGRNDLKELVILYPEEFVIDYVIDYECENKRFSLKLINI